MFTIVFFVVFNRSFLNTATTDKNHETALYRILLHHFTMLVIIKSFDLNWPSLMQLTLDIVTFIFEASDEMLTTECLIDYEFTSESEVFVHIMIYTFFPLIVIFLSLVFWFCCCGWLTTRQLSSIKAKYLDIQNHINESKRNGEDPLKDKNEQEQIDIILYRDVEISSLSANRMMLRNMLATFSVVIYMAYTTIFMKTIALFS